MLVIGAVLAAAAVSALVLVLVADTLLRLARAGAGGAPRRAPGGGGNPTAAPPSAAAPSAPPRSDPKKAKPTPAPPPATPPTSPPAEGTVPPPGPGAEPPPASPKAAPQAGAGRGSGGLGWRGRSGSKESLRAAIPSPVAPLDTATRQRYARSWERLVTRFDEEPAVVLVEAERFVRLLLDECGQTPAAAEGLLAQSRALPRQPTGDDAADREVLSRLDTVVRVLLGAGGSTRV